MLELVVHFAKAFRDLFLKADQSLLDRAYFLIRRIHPLLQQTEAMIHMVDNVPKGDVLLFTCHGRASIPMGSQSLQPQNLLKRSLPDFDGFGQIEDADSFDIKFQVVGRFADFVNSKIRFLGVLS